MPKNTSASLITAGAATALGSLLLVGAARADLPRAEIAEFTWGGSGCPGRSVGHVFDEGRLLFQPLTVLVART